MTSNNVDSPTPAAFAQLDCRLGWDPIDEVHDEFVELVCALTTATESAVPSALRAVRLHCESHFKQEEAWMAETGFPASRCHTDEHAAVLASLVGVERRVALGDVGAARRLARALMDWFPGHADHLDSALAHWMCVRRLGGQPVVLRRPAPSPLHSMN